MLNIYIISLSKTFPQTLTLSTKFYHATQIILYMWSCHQSLVTLAFLWENLSEPRFCKDLTRKTIFFQSWAWFKFNNLGLALGMTLKFYTSVAKRLKLKVEKFWGLSLTFVAVTGEKLVGGLFASPPSTHTPTPNTPHTPLPPSSWMGLKLSDLNAYYF